jgi:hypothetical protein
MKFFCLAITLIPSAIGSSLFSPQDDPCVHLCNAYTAERRGAGFDLCDSHTSQCVRTLTSEICTNLYWSRTEDGTDGYVFSPPGAGDLTADEAGRPVLCFDAVRDTAEDFNFIHEGVIEYGRLVTTLESVHVDHTQEPFRLIFLYMEQFNQSNVQYSLFHDLFVLMRQAV